ncbi:MAG: sugar transferase [Clostridia bacterium]|nr:sugar transferase [Clostridia bacterium]
MAMQELLVKESLSLDNEQIIKRHRFQKGIKRLIDVVVALVLSIFTLPILLIACIAIKIESKGSPIYKQPRCGFRGRSFTAYKLRTMYEHSSDGNYAAPKEGDKRVTKVGKLLRKTSVDELPQLFNVLKGDMSVLGPRAVPFREIELRIESMMENDSAREEEYERMMEIRSLIRPGISGMAQANGRSCLTVEEATKYDVYYVLNYSLGLDIKVLFKTIGTVFFQKGVN